VWWRKKKKENPILALREMLFSEQRLDESLNVDGAEPQSLQDVEPDRVLGVVTEIGYKLGTVIIAGFANGDARLLWTTGGGLIGDLSRFPNIAGAAQELVKVGQEYVLQFPISPDRPLPAPDRVRFSLLTTGGVHAMEESEFDVQMPGHPYFDLFVATNALITELRLLEEGMQKKGKS
jgi:hypothetical protein